MLTWTDEKLTPTGSRFAAVSDITDAALFELWTKFWPLVELRQQREWDIIRAEVWLDSGRLLIFPAKRGVEERIDDIVFELTSPALLNDWEAAADGDEDELDAASNSICADVVAALKRSIPIASAGKTRKASLVVIDPDEDIPLLEAWL